MRPQDAYFEGGLRHYCPVYNVSCVLYLLQYTSLFFILHGWIPSGPVFYIYIMN